MRKPHHILLTTMLFMSLSLMATTFDYPIETVNGQRVYRYPVQKSEGLWRISQTFGVSQEEILRLNPSLSKTGLRFGETILIPVKDEDIPATPQTTITETTYDTIQHIIKKKETLYSISRQYGVTVKTIEDANPQMAKKMHVDAILYIPVPKQQTAAPVETTSTETKTSETKPIETKPTEPQTVTTIQYDTIEHVIQKKETLYRISKMYGVKVADIEAANPTMAKKMHVDAVLKIPVLKEVTTAVAAETPKTEETKTEQPKTEQPETAQQQTEIAKAIHAVNTFKHPEILQDSLKPITWTQPLTPIIDSSMLQLPLRIAYLLPFSADALKRDASSDRFVSFYQGALLAVKELQDKGQPLELYIYDTDKSEARLQQILQQTEMLNIDAIIGPAYPQQVKLAAQFAFENHIPMLIPFTSKVNELDNNPYLFQFNPTDELTEDYIVQYLSKDKNKTHCLFVNTTAGTDEDDMQRLEKRIRKANISCHAIREQNITPDTLKTILSTNKRNIIFFDTDKASQADYVVNQLLELKGYNISLFVHYSWAKTGNALPLIYTTIFNDADPETPAMIFYNNAFKHYFKNLPQDETPRYDLLGYDLSKYMIEILQQGSETPFNIRVLRTPYKGLQIDIDPKSKDRQSGTINNNIRIETKSVK